MFAIQNGTKFIQASQWNDHELSDVVTSATPKLYKNLEQARKIKTLTDQFITERVQAQQELLAEYQQAIVKFQKKFETSEAQLTKLAVQPHKEVAKKIQTVTRARDHAKWAVQSTANSIKDLKRSVSHWERIRNAGITVVRVQQTVVAV